MQPPDGQDEAARLYEMGELGDVELDHVMQDWREVWDKAQEPDFSFCVGLEGTAAKWLKGQEAKRAAYRWAGIPLALTRRWSLERARAGWIIRKLERG